MDYNEFQQSPISNKIQLLTLDAAKRLMGWTLHSGTIYKFVNFESPLIININENGSSLVEKLSVGTLTPGSYYFDRTNKTIYLKTTNATHPNAENIIVFTRFFFSTAPIKLPYNLTDGDEVYWEPILLPGSFFRNNMDTINQTSQIIEGTGSIRLINNQSFWDNVFNSWEFDNKDCSVYSWSTDLDSLSDVKILFRGFINNKKYQSNSIIFNLRDEFVQLKQTVPLKRISELNERAGTDQDNYFQRSLYGNIKGHVGVNIDRVLDGYPIAGLARGIFNQITRQIDLEFVDTEFTKYVSPRDNLIINGFDFEVETITSDTVAVFSNINELQNKLQPFWNVPIYLIPDSPKRFMNRKFNLSGHPVREPKVVCLDNCTITTLYVESTTDINEDDVIYIGELGSEELSRVKSISGNNLIFLQTSLSKAPIAGTSVTRPSVQNVRLNNIPLRYNRDYNFNAETGILTLSQDAELNAALANSLGFSITFTNLSKTVTGSGFAQLKPGQFIGTTTTSEYFEIHSVNSDTELTLVDPATYTATASGRFKNFIVDDDTILNCDILGRTDNDTPSGALLTTVPQIILKLLEESNIAPELIDYNSFTYAHKIVYQQIGMVIPSTVSNTESPSYINVINDLNRGILGSLIIKHIDLDTKLHYHILHPKKSVIHIKKFDQFDIINFTFDSVATHLVRDVNIEYNKKEYDWSINNSSSTIFTSRNNHSEYVSEINNSRTISTLLVNESDARVSAGRWSFLLSRSMGAFNFTIKTLGMLVSVGDVIEITHEKLFIGTHNRRRLFMVESVEKNGFSVNIKCVDLGNTFNSVACINDYTNTYQTSTEDERLYGGYITDEYGMQDNESNTFGLNLIW